MGRGVAEIADDARHQLAGGGDDIDHAGLDGAARHAVGAGVGGFLGEGQPAFLLDGAEAEHAVGAHAGEDHADGPVLAVIGQRAQKEIDGQVQTVSFGGIEQVQDAVT